MRREEAAEENVTVEELTKRRKRTAVRFWEAMSRDARVGVRTNSYAQEQLELHWGVRPSQELKVSGGRSDGERPTVVVREIIVHTRSEAQAILAQKFDEHQRQNGHRHRTPASG
jgi:hypothetical protein